MAEYISMDEFSQIDHFKRLYVETGKDNEEDLSDMVRWIPVAAATGNAPPSWRERLIAAKELLDEVTAFEKRRHERV